MDVSLLETRVRAKHPELFLENGAPDHVALLARLTAAGHAGLGINVTGLRDFFSSAGKPQSGSRRTRARQNLLNSLRAWLSGDRSEGEEEDGGGLAALRALLASSASSCSTCASRQTRRL